MGFKRNNIGTKVIGLGLSFLLVFQSISWAIPEIHSEHYHNLQVQSRLFKPITDKGLQLTGIMRAKIIAAAELALKKESVDSINKYLNIWKMKIRDNRLLGAFGAVRIEAAERLNAGVSRVQFRINDSHVFSIIYKNNEDFIIEDEESESKVAPEALAEAVAEPAEQPAVKSKYVYRAFGASAAEERSKLLPTVSRPVEKEYMWNANEKLVKNYPMQALALHGRFWYWADYMDSASGIYEFGDYKHFFLDEKLTRSFKAADIDEEIKDTFLYLFMLWHGTEYMSKELNTDISRIEREVIAFIQVAQAFNALPEQTQEEIKRISKVMDIYEVKSPNPAMIARYGRFSPYLAMLDEVGDMIVGEKDLESNAIVGIGEIVQSGTEKPAQKINVSRVLEILSGIDADNSKLKTQPVETLPDSPVMGVGSEFIEHLRDTAAVAGLQALLEYPLDPSKLAVTAGVHVARWFAKKAKPESSDDSADDSTSSTSSKARYSAELLQDLRTYYSNKKNMIEAYKRQDSDVYRQAYQEVVAASNRARERYKQGENLGAAVEKVKEEGIVDEVFLGDWDEVVRATGLELTEEHYASVRATSKVVVAALVEDEERRPEIEEKLANSVQPLLFENLFRESIEGERFHPLTFNSLMQSMYNFSNLRAVGAFGVTVPTRDKRDFKINMFPCDTIDEFRRVFIHESIHFVIGLGVIPTSYHDEVIAEGIYNCCLYQDDGIDALSKRGEAMKACFELGQSLAAEGNVVLSYEELCNVALHKILEVLGEEVNSENVRKISEDRLERHAGAILSGQAQYRSEHEGIPITKHILDYANHVFLHSKPRDPTPEEIQHLKHLISTIQQVARTSTGISNLELKPWESLSATDQPQWRYRKYRSGMKIKHEIQYVPMDLLRFSDDAAKGLFFQEIFRCLHSKPEVIGDDLKNNTIFKTLFWSTGLAG